MDRKEKVITLSEHFGTKARYLGAPSFAYEVEASGEVYTVDRAGVIFRDGTETTLEDIINLEVEGAKAQESVISDFELTLPLQGHTGNTLQNIVNMLTSRQHLIMKAFRMDEPFIDEHLAEDLSKTKINDTQEFMTFYESFGQERRNGLAFDFEDETMTIKLKSNQLSGDEIRVFTVLLSNVNEFAKKQKRASYKKVQDDNPKFALRTWITRIGMKGDRYKEDRKVLLSNLEGNGAFRNLTKQNERG